MGLCEVSQSTSETICGFLYGDGRISSAGYCPCLDEYVEPRDVNQKKADETETASEEIFTVESYFSCCKETGLTIDDLKHISIGMALDYQTDYVEVRTRETSQTRRATQADFDNF